MATRRMFSLDVVDTDTFLELPISSQALYFHLGLHGDDDGFVGSPKKVARAVGCNLDDLRLLISKGFVIPFETSGVIVIRDWKLNNTIKPDRYRETIYQAEKAQLSVDASKRYQLGSTMEPGRLQGGSALEPQIRVVKNREGEGRIEKENPPSCSEPQGTSEPPIFTLPLNDGGDYPISKEQCQEWASLYPAVDVAQQLRNMRGWLQANPAKRKTRRGVLRFVNSWLSREQDRGNLRKGGLVDGRVINDYAENRPKVQNALEGCFD